MEEMIKKDLAGLRKSISDLDLIRYESRQAEKPPVRDIIDIAPVMLWIADAQGNFVYFNKCWLKYTGRPLQEEIGAGWIKGVHPEDIEDFMYVFKTAFRERKSFQNYTRLRRFDGRFRWLLMAGAPVLDENLTFHGYVGSCTDVDDLKTEGDHWRGLSYVDDLTGLYNRRGFMLMARQQSHTAARMNKGVLLFYIDLDNMKRINDTLGHSEGDRALIKVAAVLKKTFRQSDIIARVGGDEFVVFALESLSESMDKILKRLHDNISRINLDQAGFYKLLISVGTARSDAPGMCSVSELLEKADRLMYQQKKEKKREAGITARRW